jgi:hypothetical protein
MRKILLCASAVLALSAGSAKALTISDPTGDFLPTYAGPQTPDLDVTAFSVQYDPVAEAFLLAADFAGVITPSDPGFYVIGVNTGTGPIRPFTTLEGGDNVFFNQALIIQKTGMATLGASSLTATVLGSNLSVLVPLSLLPSTGFNPGHYGFNIWPRQVTGGLASLADFAPDNRMLAAVPEPTSWALMITGFGFAGSVLRRRRVHPVRA